MTWQSVQLVLTVLDLQAVPHIPSQLALALGDKDEPAQPPGSSPLAQCYSSHYLMYYFELQSDWINVHPFLHPRFVSPTPGGAPHSVWTIHVPTTDCFCVPNGRPPIGIPMPPVRQPSCSVAIATCPKPMDSPRCPRGVIALERVERAPLLIDIVKILRANWLALLQRRTATMAVWVNRTKLKPGNRPHNTESLDTGLTSRQNAFSHFLEAIRRRRVVGGARSPNG